MAPDAIDAIDALKDYQHRNWDSYASEPVSQNAAGQATMFVRIVRSVVGPKADPVIGPRSDGGISLLWRNGSRKTEVRIAGLPGRDPMTYVVSDDYELVAEGRVEDPLRFVISFVQPYVS